MHTNPNLFISKISVYPSRFSYTSKPALIKFVRLTEKILRARNSGMEETVSMIFHGCKLVKDLEEMLPNLANQPHVLINSCDEISRVFGNVRERLSLAVQDYGGHHETPMSMEVAGGGAVPEWLRSSHAMDMMMHEPMGHHQPHGLDQAIAGQELGGGNVEGVQTDIAHSPLQRTRRRKHEADRRTYRMPAPRMGNTDVPPDDGYTWRKYGQKEILGSKYPRGYFRCTHQKLYNCPAKKQVQRLDNDPYTFEVTYRGDHTCIMSSTAPSMPPLPPPPPSSTTVTITTHSPPANIPHTTSQPLLQWLSMDIKQSSGDLYSITHQHSMSSYRNDQSDVADMAGPSSPARYVDFQGVTDLVDTMFNSGSSSNNSMELIFSPDEEKKDGREKTN